MTLKVPAGVSGRSHPSLGRRHEVSQAPFAKALSRVGGSDYFKLLLTKAGFWAIKRYLCSAACRCQEVLLIPMQVPMQEEDTGHGGTVQLPAFGRELLYPWEKLSVPT